MARGLVWLALFCALPMNARDYRFDGRMSEEVLRSYLSRSMTTMSLLMSHGDFDDNLRMLTNCGVKFVAEVAGLAVQPSLLNTRWATRSLFLRCCQEAVFSASRR